MLFATATLARRIEEAESTLITDFARPALARLGDSRVFIQNIGGGTAVAAGPLAPFSKIAGLGFSTYVISDGCRGVNLQRGDPDRAFEEMTEKKVHVCHSYDLPWER